jgi:ethanolamine permease
MIAIMYYNFYISLIFFAGLVVCVIIFMLMGKHKIKIMDDAMLDTPQQLVNNNANSVIN